MKKTKNLIEKSENKEDIVLTIPALLELQKQIEEISRNINNQVVNNLFFNIEDVMKVFISTGDTDSEKGVLQRLKSIFDKETQTSSALLLKKAGMEGSATSSNNTLSKKIAKYEEKITRMQTIFASKQQALYSKYARLETLMNNLNSQSSSLSSMFSS